MRLHHMWPAGCQRCVQSQHQRRTGFDPRVMSIIVVDVTWSSSMGVIFIRGVHALGIDFEFLFGFTEMHALALGLKVANQEPVSR